MRRVRTARKAALLLVALAGAGCSLVYDLGGYVGSPSAPAEAGSDAPVLPADGASDAGDASSGDTGVDGALATPYVDAVLADAPSLYYRFEELARGKVVDSSGNGHDGTHVGQITLGADGALKERSHGIRLDGASGFVRAGDLLHFAGLAPMTVELWAKPDSLDTGYRGLVTNEPDLPTADRQGWLIWAHAELGLGVERFRDGTGNGNTADALPVGAYHHVVVTYDGALVLGYIDAKEVLRFSTALALTSPSTSLLVIGARGSGAGEFFAGSIDDVAIYEKALSAARINAHYAAGTAN